MVSYSYFSAQFCRIPTQDFVTSLVMTLWELLSRNSDYTMVHPSLHLYVRDIPIFRVFIHLLYFSNCTWPIVSSNLGSINNKALMCIMVSKQLKER